MRLISAVTRALRYDLAALNCTYIISIQSERDVQVFIVLLDFFYVLIFSYIPSKKCVFLSRTDGISARWSTQCFFEHVYVRNSGKFWSFCILLYEEP